MRPSARARSASAVSDSDTKIGAFIALRISSDRSRAVRASDKRLSLKRANPSSYCAHPPVRPLSSGVARTSSRTFSWICRASERCPRHRAIIPPNTSAKVTSVRWSFWNSTTDDAAAPAASSNCPRAPSDHPRSLRAKASRFSDLSSLATARTWRLLSIAAGIFPSPMSAIDFSRIAPASLARSPSSRASDAASSLEATASAGRLRNCSPSALSVSASISMEVCRPALARSMTLVSRGIA